MPMFIRCLKHLMSGAFWHRKIGSSLSFSVIFMPPNFPKFRGYFHKQNLELESPKCIMCSFDLISACWGQVLICRTGFVNWQSSLSLSLTHKHTHTHPWINKVHMSCFSIWHLGNTLIFFPPVFLLCRCHLCSLLTKESLTVIGFSWHLLWGQTCLLLVCWKMAQKDGEMKPF